MYCTNCGTQLNNDDVFCPTCGAMVGEQPPPTSVQNDVAQPIQTIAPTSTPPATNAIAIVGFVLAFTGLVVPALICGFLGLKKANRGAPHKGLAIAGIIISILVAVFIVVGAILLNVLYAFIDAVNIVTFAPLLFLP